MRILTPILAHLFWTLNLVLLAGLTIYAGAIWHHKDRIEQSRLSTSEENHTLLGQVADEAARRLDGLKAGLEQAAPSLVSTGSDNGRLSFELLAGILSRHDVVRLALFDSQGRPRQIHPAGSALAFSELSSITSQLEASSPSAAHFKAAFGARSDIGLSQPYEYESQVVADLPVMARSSDGTPIGGLLATINIEKLLAGSARTQSYAALPGSLYWVSDRTSRLYLHPGRLALELTAEQQGLASILEAPGMPRTALTSGEAGPVDLPPLWLSGVEHEPVRPEGVRLLGMEIITPKAPEGVVYGDYAPFRLGGLEMVGGYAYPPTVLFGKIAREQQILVRMLALVGCVMAIVTVLFMLLVRRRIRRELRLGMAAEIEAGIKARIVQYEVVASTLKRLFDALPQAVSVINADMNIIMSNEPFHELLKVTGQQDQATIPIEPFVPRLVAERLSRAVKEGVACEGLEFRSSVQSGTQDTPEQPAAVSRRLRADIIPLAGEKRRAMLLVNDISDLAEANRRRTEIEKSLLVETMIAGVGRSFLDPIEQLAEQLSAGAGPDELIDRIDSLRAVVSKIATPRRSKETGECAIHEALSDALNVLDPALRQAGIVLKNKVNRQLPKVRMERERLALVFRNLIENSIFALNEKQEMLHGIPLEKTVIIDDEVEDLESVRVTVRDNGAGIEQQLLDRIYDPFFTTREKSGAIGIGLFVCQREARLGGGRIEHTSRRGDGTEARIHLKIAESPEI